jgi:flagellar protein FliO/FliZ
MGNLNVRWVVFIMALAAAAVSAGDTVQVVLSPDIAGDTAQAQTSVTGLTDSVLPSLTRLGLSLLAIIAIIYITIFLMRKVSGNRVGRGRTIQIIEQTYLAPKKSVCLLRLADRVVLVGITDNSINLLTELDCESIPREYLDKLTQPPAGFPGALNDAIGKLLGRKETGGDHASPR